MAVLLAVFCWLDQAIEEFLLTKPHPCPHGSYPFSKKPGITCWIPTSPSLGSPCLCYHGNTSVQFSHYTFRNLGVFSWRLGNRVSKGALTISFRLHTPAYCRCTWSDNLPPQFPAGDGAADPVLSAPSSACLTYPLSRT